MTIKNTKGYAVAVPMDKSQAKQVVQRIDSKEPIQFCNVQQEMYSEVCYTNIEDAQALESAILRAL